MENLNLYGTNQDERIERIQCMESIFDQLQEMVRNDPHAMEKDPEQKKRLKILMNYYEGGQWLSDYESDERGELPVHLKRGILSEDGVYNLLTELGEYVLK